ncbi:hypothetical protein V8F20_003271 [Naviculisporaceae sp. PSN 640]
MTSRFCRWKPCSEVQSFGGKFCTRHTCGGGLDGDCTNKIAFVGAERCIHHKCSVVDCASTKLDYADVNYCLTHYRGGAGGSTTSFPNLSTTTQDMNVKDEPAEGVVDVEDLAGLDTASTALVVYNGKDQFKGSACRDSYCNEPATGESSYCRLHKCWRPGCNAQRVFEAKQQKWSQGCGSHSCRYRACLTIREKGSDYCAGHIQPCKVYNCPRRAHANGPWCNFHRLCRTPDCSNKRMNYSAYCSLHGCTRGPGCTEPRSACTKPHRPEPSNQASGYHVPRDHHGRPQATRSHTYPRPPGYNPPYY